VLDRGKLDGVDPRVAFLYGTVASAGICSLTGTGATFGSALLGLPVHIISGKGRGQSRRIVAVSSATLTVQHPWKKKPDSTSVYQIGGVAFRMTTGTFDLPADGMDTGRKFGVEWMPTTRPGVVNLRIFYDQEEDAQVLSHTSKGAEHMGFTATKDDEYLTADMTRQDGYAEQQIDGRRTKGVPGARGVTFELSGVANGDGLQIQQIELEGIGTPSRGE
jgi:hypothetical protein